MTRAPLTVLMEPRYVQATMNLVSLVADQAPVELPLWHLDGVDWVDVDAPPRRHEHWPQTVGVVDDLGETWRCPCGAIGCPTKPWVLLDKPRVKLRSWRLRGVGGGRG